MFNSHALAKIQSIIIITIIVVATVSGSLLYLFFSNQKATDTIRIGVLADLDGATGRHIWQGAMLASEQINSENGLLGRQVEVIGEDHDLETEVDMNKVSSALTRLISYHNVDFVIGQAYDQAGFICQDISAEFKTIYMEVDAAADEFGQRVLDNYEKYKYYFRNSFNVTSAFNDITKGLLYLRENTGFNKVGCLSVDQDWANGIVEGLDYVLPELYGFDVVYKGYFPLGTIDFTSYFAAAENAGVEVLVPFINLNEGIPFAKEWYDRQSPMVVYSGYLALISAQESWDWTEGKCEYITVPQLATIAGYPLTSKTIQSEEAYISRWGEAPQWAGSNAYDMVRFILADAIKRAGTVETEAVIKALEETSVETANARNFVFTSSHGVMIGDVLGKISVDYQQVLLFQWQNGDLIPVYPKEIMEEAGATYMFPPWPGPWDEIS